MAKRLLFGMLLLATPGCATLFGTHRASYDFTSVPPGADVYLDGERLGHTPLKMDLSNHKSMVVTFKKDGYRDTTCRLDSKVGGGWVILDVLGGLIPVIVDAATGQWSQLPDHDCHVALETAG